MYVLRGPRIEHGHWPSAKPATVRKRALRVYTRDPSVRADQGQQTALAIPYEQLANGRGARLQIMPVEHRQLRPGVRMRKWPPLPDLDAAAIVAEDGLPPSTTDPSFAQQMVYAVASWTLERFRRALGREPDYAFADALRLQVYASEMPNASYDRDRRALSFGYFYAHPNTPGRSQGGAMVHTALSHDIIIHEMSHALLDGMRSHLLLPTNPDVLAFHEGFADLVALLAHFSHRDIVEKAIARTPHDLDDAMLMDLGRQFGQSYFGTLAPLRTGVPEPGTPEREQRTELSYRDTLEPHARGAILCSAVMEAFRVVYRRKTADLRALHTDPGMPPTDPMVRLLAKVAAKLAEEFLDIAIRAIDYLPPVDASFGEYLRALVTADHDLIPDDPLGYREALVYAFRRHGVTVDEVLDLGEDSLLWDQPDSAGPLLLNDAALRAMAGQGHLMARVACPLSPCNALANHVEDFLNDNAAQLEQLGLIAPYATGAGPIVIESLRTLRRRGAARSWASGYVIEIVQQRMVDGFGAFHGGCTLIVADNGQIDYVIRKRVNSEERLAQQRLYLAGCGYRYAALVRNPDVPEAQAALARALHGHRWPPCC